MELSGLFDPRIRDGIIATANAIGADPVDLATVLSYETGGTMNPTQTGPTTQWGQHRGFIQFGEPQAKQYGVDWSRPVESQLGADGAVARYLVDNGYKPGMGLLDLYSTVNAGAPGRYNASDANNGGAAGTVRDKVTGQMEGHREKALALLGQIENTPAMGIREGDLPAANGLAQMFASLPVQRPQSPKSPQQSNRQLAELIQY